jgi:hypothetical protein
MPTTLQKSRANLAPELRLAVFAITLFMSRSAASFAAAARRLISTSDSFNPHAISITVKSALDSKPSSPSSAIRIQGWVRSVRRQKQLAFIEVCDGSTSSAIQIVLPPASLPAELFMGSSISVRLSLHDAMYNRDTFACDRAASSNAAAR